MIGGRIKLVRDICGLTQEELGKLIGTTQSGVASMEAGIYRPSAAYIETIAHKTTGFTTAFFDKPELMDFPFGTLLYRAQVSVKPGERTRAHALALIAFELAVALAEKLKKVPVNIPKLDDEPQKCAQITRASLGLSPNTPIQGLLRCLERNGVWIFSIPIETDGFDGFSAWAGSPPKPVIAMLQGKSAYREVFTCGEELAHLVMHSPLRVSTGDADREARMFAQEFLLPAEAMSSEMQRPITVSSLAALKSRWGVSIRFLAKRAESLELINRNQYRYLVQQMNSQWGSKAEPGDENVVPERPRMIRKMAEMLYGDPIDTARLSKDSGLSPQMLRGMLGVEHVAARILEFKRA
jgi:Zn-dependent peptidase ImmA (M78 family)/DNA-binding XRE family transcriptional regulator